IHPVAACATAAVSLEEAFDKIRSGRAAVVVAGGFDDFGHEGLIGFAAMNATASSDAMEAAGIEARRMSRANDRRRAGFVEGQGGGTVVVARGDIAYELGLPVRGVIAWAGSFSDGINTSIPAPGLGLIGAVRGGGASPLARALRSLGLDADDIAVVSKHDTSTAANDPNESLIHERLSSALGRHEDNPLYVISQKTVTGHAKGGAAAFQTNGLCQVLESGAIPPNRSLDCVDGDLERYARLVWPTEPLHHRGSLRAGLLTSLGFGHVAAIVAIVHPEAFVATIEPDRRDDYRRRAAQRSERGQRRRVAARVGGAPLYVRPDHRLGDRPAARRDLEAAMLVDPDARLGPDGTYRVPTIDQAAS
ncbi:MAG: beta-ketoacyl synthase, partial [Microthrixaceae bacterium]|nr:beta-ketoacyl synthase [Microthrixaceae bacterium]